MWRRMVLLVALCSLAGLLSWGVRPSAAEPPKSTPDAPKAAETAKPPAVGKAAASRVVAVTVYPLSALVTREVDVPAGTGTVELTVTPLPPTTVQSSLYAEGSEALRVLSTRFRSRPVFEDTREDVRRLQDELQQLERSREKAEADTKAVEATQQHLTKLETFTTVSTNHSAEKGRLDSDAALALSKYIIETRTQQFR